MRPVPTYGRLCHRRGDAQCNMARLSFRWISNCYGVSVTSAPLRITAPTFSDFYCLERGGDVDAFRADLEAARCAAGTLGIKLASIAFPRNQVAHLSVCREFGLRAFRGNERVWFHRARSEAEQTHVVRASRLLDSYLP